MRYILFFLALALSSCKNEIVENQLIVSIDKIALRAAPGVKGAEMKALRQGDKLLDLGQVSHFESEILFGGTPLRMPWLKVETEDKQQGWIFAGAVKPSLETADWLLQKRLDCYFGHAFTVHVQDLKSRLPDIQSSATCANTYREAIAMRDSMVYVLSHRAEPEGVPEYEWLTDVLPGFIFQRRQAGAAPDLFVDYHFWWPKAVASEGADDDEFFETCFFIFPQDSIESEFPVWKFQFSDSESASQLGTGIHLKVLQRLDETLRQSKLFEPELISFKDELLEDIQDKNTRFWQSSELILKELDAILANPPACLNVKEITALQLRRGMLESPEQNGIKVNLRSGE